MAMRITRKKPPSSGGPRRIELVESHDRFPTEKQA